MSSERPLPVVADPLNPTEEEVQATTRYWHDHGHPVPIGEMTVLWVVIRLVALVCTNLCLLWFALEITQMAFRAFLSLYFLQRRLERWRVVRLTDASVLLELMAVFVRRMCFDEPEVLARLDEWSQNQRSSEGARPLIEILRIDPAVASEWEDVEEEPERASNEGSGSADEDGEGENDEGGVGAGEDDDGVSGAGEDDEVTGGAGENDGGVGGARAPTSRGLFSSLSLPVSSSALCVLCSSADMFIICWPVVRCPVPDSNSDGLSSPTSR